MATLPVSRSEGALSMTGDASLFKSTGGLSSTASDGRTSKRNGLSWEEVNCFRRYPQPSANMSDKVPLYWQHIGGSRQKYMEKGLHTLPNEKGAFYNRPEFKNPMSATQEEWNARMSATKATMTFSAPGVCGYRRGAFSKPGRWHSTHPLSSLDAEEEQLGRIVRLMFPSTRQQMARVGSSLRSRRSGTPASRPESSAATIAAFTPLHNAGISPRPPPIITAPTTSGSDFHKTVSFETAASPAGGNGKVEPVQWDIKSPVGGLDPGHLRSKLKLLKRETDMHWDPSKSNGMGKNASRIVKMAGMATDTERDVDSSHFSVNTGYDQGKQVYKAMKKASIAVHYLVQAMGDEARMNESILSHQPQKPAPMPMLGRPGGSGKDDPVDQNSFSLRAFRNRLIERYSSVLEAFNSIDVDTNRKLNVKEWKTVLNAHGLASQSEARVIFHLLDSNNDGNMTLNEFHVGLESIAPVRDLETMRKRLLCLGCSSMMQALGVMNGSDHDMTMRPLNFNEFASALTRVWIVEPAEHRAIWEAVISDPNVRQNEATVSIAELAAGMCAVSPCLLVEEIRDRLLKKFGSFTKAWGVLFADAGDPAMCVGREEFQRLASQRLGLTTAEARKLFILLDIDCSGEISRGEFIGAMALATPSLIIEEVRRKVRQRFLSIDLAFRGAFSHLEGEELNNNLRLSLEEFVDILEPLDIGRKDTRCLFNLIDGDHQGRLTLFEFFKGVRLVAPACILEGIRLQLIQSYGRIADAFSQVPATDRRAPLDCQGFRMLMQQLQIDCDDVDLIFDFLDVRNSGIVTINEIAAALLNVQPGSWNKAAVLDREQRAEREVKSQLAPHHRAVNELKRRVKLGLREATTDHMPRIHRRLEKEETSRVSESAAAAADPNLRLPKVPQQQPLTRAQSLPAETSQEGPPASALDARALVRTASSEGNRPSANPKTAYQRLDRRFKQLPPDKAVTTRTTDSLRGYFKSAHTTLRDHGPLMHMNYTRTGVHRETQNLKRAALRTEVQAQIAQ